MAGAKSIEILSQRIANFLRAERNTEFCACLLFVSTQRFPFIRLEADANATIFMTATILVMNHVLTRVPSVLSFDFLIDIRFLRIAS